MTWYTLDQIPASYGIQWIWSSFLADPTVPLSAVARYVMVPAAVLALALWALVALLTRYPDQALPEPEALPDPTPSGLAVEIMAGRVPIDKTVVIEQARR